MAIQDHEQERKADLAKILASEHPRRVVVAGPGTGKSYLFEKAINEEKKHGKKKFLALTFIGKLGDALADDLAGLAETTTLHGFARKFVLAMCPRGWQYYPKMTQLIGEDLNVSGIKGIRIGDDKYEERTKYYKAVGEEDVIFYALKILKKDDKNIPLYDLILIDEFQDFNEVEAEFIDILATRNKVIVVGDDDQALYEFKGSSPNHIRDRYDASNTDFEKHTLRFCSRCTSVIIDAFHSILDHFDLDRPESSRIKKEYVCYLPANEGNGKKQDSDLNPQIYLSEGTKLGQIHHLIKDQLGKILESQKIKSVLIIGEGRSCKKMLLSVAKNLRDFGFKYVDHRLSENKPFSFRQHLIDGYKILASGENELLAWRLLVIQLNEADRRKLIAENYADAAAFINAIPKDFRNLHTRNAQVLSKILSKPESDRNQIADSSIKKLVDEIVSEKRTERELAVNQLITENKNLPRPLNGLDITVTNILGSKGLGADVVFLVGFDQGKLPTKNDASESEVYQMLVALTRAKKRLYLINTIGCPISQFRAAIPNNLIQPI